MCIISINFSDNLPAMFGLFFAGILLIYQIMITVYKVDIFNQSLKWFKRRPIIVTSLFFVASPFIFTLMYNGFVKNSDTLIKAFTPITCIAAYIAYQQYQINRQTLRKNLSDKRVQIFIYTMKLISAAKRNNPELIQERLNDFEPHRYEAHFLLGKEVNQKLEEICAKAYDLIALKSNIENHENYAKEQQSKDSAWDESQDKNEIVKDLQNDLAKSKEIREYFITEIPTTIKDLFEPYIDLSNIAIERYKP